MNILVWHVHGSWMTAFVQGPHTYLVPVVPDRGPDGRGRAQTWDWPASVVEVTPDDIADAQVDVVIVQRQRDLDLYRQWRHRTMPNHAPPVIWVEHDTPLDLRCPRHPSFDVDEIDLLVHVTHFNSLMWQSSGPVRVVEHGVVDPGHLYTGAIPHAVTAINEPLRRYWVAGTDLVQDVRRQVPVDIFGMQSEGIGGRDVIQRDLHAEMADRRLYLHPFRWTSLGLSLIEAMHLGMPVVALAATEAIRAVPPEAGMLVSNADAMASAVVELLNEPQRCDEMGRAARRHALERYSLDTFLASWDEVLSDLVRR